MSKKFLARFINRNPRNLEMMGLQPKPLGYGLEVDRHRRSFIYKYVINLFSLNKLRIAVEILN